LQATFAHKRGRRALIKVFTVLSVIDGLMSAIHGGKLAMRFERGSVPSGKGS
jgi:hypothetical protein